MIPNVPVPNEQGDVAIWRAEWHGNDCTIVDSDATVATGSTLEIEGGEIEEASDLVLHLELVGPIPTWGDGAIGAQHSILPTILPMLDPIPCANRSSNQNRSECTQPNPPLLKQANNISTLQDQTPNLV